MNERRSGRSKVVVVHRGARDAYQLAAALAEAGLLEYLVTDLYWPNDRSWAAHFTSHVYSSIRQMLLGRYSPLVPSRLVNQKILSGVLSHFFDKLPGTPFTVRRKATRWTDRVLGRTAGTKALAAESSLLSYSYYGFDAFTAYRKPAMLFQVHPHPASVRRILQRELEAHPECAASLRQEWELSLESNEFERLAAESQMAAHTFAASSFTRRTLEEHGIDQKTISVIPYGVDLRHFSPANCQDDRNTSGCLKLLFVGRINQRKGIKYLLEALRLVSSKNAHLTVCGRVVDDLSLFKPFGSQVTIRPSVTATELVDAYRTADLFVFPSVAEGFGHVLLESLACGLPCLSTTHTAAPDLIREGLDGFVVQASNSAVLAERIEWALANRAYLKEMRAAARERATYFTWSRFRKAVVAAVLSFNEAERIDSEVNAHYA